MKQTSDLSSEWLLLQSQFDRYEVWSLVIKLAAIAAFVVALMQAQVAWVWLVVFALFWGQDAIWKTFQARIGVRLLQIEAAFHHGEVRPAFQFNSEFLKQRPGAGGLILSYLRQSMRPTVAFPHLFTSGLMVYMCL